MTDLRRVHAAAESIASRWPTLCLVELGGHRPLSTADLLTVALVALEAADEVDDGD